MSAANIPAVSSATVRHTPLTDTLSPSVSSPASSVRTPSRTPVPVRTTWSTWPTASMRPVNIPLDDDIRAERFDSLLEQRESRKRATVERNALLAEWRRRHKELDVVCEFCVPDRRMEDRPSFDHDALDVACRQLAQRERNACCNWRHDRGARVLECHSPRP